MEDKFDKYLKQELDSITNAPISSQLWDKENTWKKISTGLMPMAKTISIKWFYAAASIVIILLGFSVIYYKNNTSQISMMKNENYRLRNLILAQNALSKQNENKPIKTVTVFQTKERVKKEIVQNTVYIHDTVIIANYVKEPVNVTVALNNTKKVSDSSVITSSGIPEIKNKLCFVITGEPNNAISENKFMLVSSKSLPQKEQETGKPDVAIKIAFN
jgi:hypothetical protein